MVKLGNFFLLFIILLMICPDWGNIVESELNLALETEFEIDLDEDGIKESDKSENEINLTNIFLYFEKEKVSLINRETLYSRRIVLNDLQNNYSFHLISRIERPPNLK